MFNRTRRLREKAARFFEEEARLEAIAMYHEKNGDPKKALEELKHARWHARQMVTDLLEILGIDWLQYNFGMQRRDEVRRSVWRGLANKQDHKKK